MRQLWVMHAERRRFLGELAAVQMSWLARVFTGQQIDPHDLNPYREAAPERPPSPEQLERENAAAWRLLDKFFGGD